MIVSKSFSFAGVKLFLSVESMNANIFESSVSNLSADLKPMLSERNSICTFVPKGLSTKFFSFLSVQQVLPA